HSPSAHPARRRCRPRRGRGGAVNAATAEALADPRIGAVSEEELEAELARWDDDSASADGVELDDLRRGREIEWATRTLTQGEVLDSFAAYCRDELEDVEVAGQAPSRIDLVWRRERSAIELRAGFLFCERLAGDGPLLLLG